MLPEFLTMVNPMTISGLMECIAFEFAEFHSRKLGHTDRH